MYNESLSYRLSQLVLSSGECTIQLIPESELPIVSEVHDEITEIGLSKRTYLQLFKESHTYWHSALQSAPSGKQDPADLLEAYYCTFGYLLTTNENHSLIKLHESIFFKLQHIDESESNGVISLESEFKLITALLTSRLKKINKSSSLWLWLKKLSIMLIFKDIVSDEVDSKTIANFTKLIDSILKASELHFANYYASNFLRWCIRMVKLNSARAEELLGLVAMRLTKLCRLHLTDVSMWGSLQVLFENGSRNEQINEYIVEDYNAIASEIPKPYSTPIITALSKRDYYTFPSAYAHDELAWLLSVKCSIVTPYICVFSHEGLITVEGKLQQQYTELNKLSDKDSFLYQETSHYISVLERVVQKYRAISGRIRASSPT
ncbi:hypothetical protein CLIB1423_18S03092 [[Candida] railenensis]|uniref:Uncharacterized protein n=1 Tax=[Candida] railenensis TaxID=45579 RepID=A0A9P0QUX6_9ASCO|nr:hypothetical protein CLIB1423_18S03092 [[Candida] railenensis]